MPRTIFRIVVLIVVLALMGKSTAVKGTGSGANATGLKVITNPSAQRIEGQEYRKLPASYRSRSIYTRRSLSRATAGEETTLDPTLVTIQRILDTTSRRSRNDNGTAAYVAYGPTSATNAPPFAAAPLINDIGADPPGLSQAVAALFGGPFSLTVSGQNFDDTSRIRFDGVPIPTVLVNARQLTGTVTTVLLGTAGSIAVTVSNLDPGNQELISNSVNMKVVERGDVNGNGSITIGDALVTALNSGGLNRPPFAVSVGDLNLSGATNIGDALVIALFAGGIATNHGVPTIVSTDPSRATPGNALVISGSGFSPVASDNRVSFATAEGFLRVLPSAASLTSLTVSVPLTAVSGAVQVYRTDIPVGGAEYPLEVTGSLLPLIVTSLSSPAATTGDQLTLRGIGFDAIPSNNTVRFKANNGTIAAPANSVSATSLTVTVPPGAICGPVTVAAGDKTSNARTVMVAGPCGIQLVGLWGNGSPGDTVVLEGTGFDSVTPRNNTVRFARSSGGFTEAAVLSAGLTQLHVRVPIDATAGDVTVSVRGSTSNTLQYIPVSAPTLASIIPSDGVQGTTKNVTLTGTGFTAGSTSIVVSGTGVTVSNVSVVNSTMLTATLIINNTIVVGPRTVTVSTPAGTSGSLSFTVIPLVLSVTSVSPSSGIQGTTVNATVSGTNLTGVTAVTFGGTGVTSTILPGGTATTLPIAVTIATTAPLGARDITVTTPDRAATSARAFTVTSPTPILVSVVPPSGIRGTKVSVVITGNFLNDVVLNPVSGVTVASATLTATTSIAATLEIDPNAALGSRNLLVTNSIGSSNTIPFVVADLARMSLLDDNSGVTTEVTINEGNTIRPRFRFFDTAGSGHDNLDIPVSISSLNAAVASVDTAGNIKGQKAGFSTLRMTVGNSVETGTVTVVQINAGLSAAGISDVVVDSAQRLYLAASSDHTVRLAADASKPAEVYAGVPGSLGFSNTSRLQSLFNTPSFLALDRADGALYIADSANHVIRKALPGPNGRVETVAGTGSPGAQDGPAAKATFRNPSGLALDPTGQLWVVDSGNHTIRRITLSTGEVQTVAGLAGNSGAIDDIGTKARFNAPAGIAIEGESLTQELQRFFEGKAPSPISVVVADSGNGLLRRVKQNGQVETLQSTSQNALTSGRGKALMLDSPDDRKLLLAVPSGPTGIAVDPFGNIYFTEPSSNRISIRLTNGKVVAATQANTFREPRGLAIGQAGRPVVIDVDGTRGIRFGEPQILSISPSQANSTGGTRVTISGHNFAPDSVVAVAGVLASNLQIENTETITITVPAAPSGGSAVTVQNRAGIAQAEFLLRPIPYEQLQERSITTLAGGSTFAGDGGIASRARLKPPGETAVDRAGNLYILEPSNHRVRRVSSKSGVIVTIAGTGRQGYSGDGGLAIAANLSWPSGIALDDDGNLYIADFYNSRIRMVSAQTGVITTVAGANENFSGDGGPATTAGLCRPSDVVVANNNLYIADTGNNRIRKVDLSTRNITTLAGSGPACHLVSNSTGDGGLAISATMYNPSHIAIDNAGDLFIKDRGNGGIRKVSVSTGLITTADFNGGEGLAVDSSGALLIANSPWGTIRKVDLVTGLSTIVLKDLNNVWNVTVDPSGDLLVSESGNCRLSRYSPDKLSDTTIAGKGTCVISEENIPAFAATIAPFGATVAADAQSNVFFVDTEQHSVRRIDRQSGLIATIAGNGTGGFTADNQVVTGKSVSLTGAPGLAIDTDGNLYLRDNDRLRKIDAATRTITTVTLAEYGFSGDGGPASLAKIFIPTGITVDSSGNLYFIDSGNYRIRRIDTKGTIQTIAGSGVQGSLGDGGRATEAAIDPNFGIAADGKGNLYFAERSNRVRKVDLIAGTISTLFEGLAVANSIHGNGYVGALAIASNGDLLGSAGERIFRWSNATGTLIPIAGTGLRDSSGDGGPALDATFFAPGGFTVDKQGNLLILDVGPGRIRIVRGPF